MAAFSRSLVCAVVCAALPWGGLSGQSLDAAGTVVLVGESDSVPLPGVRVVLHQVGRDFQGPIDTMISDARGRFHFRAARDTSSLYLLSANHHGIEYFSAPIHTNPDRPDTAMVLAVSDTSSSQPVTTAQRQLVVGAPDPDGTRPVVDLFRMQNSGFRTRVAGAAQKPTWTGRLDPGVIGFQVGQSDFSAEAVFRRGDTLEVFGPISPGAKELMLRYLVPGRDLAVVTDEDLQRVTVLVEEAEAQVRAPATMVEESQSAGGRTFRSWTGPMAAHTALTIHFPRAGDNRLILISLVAAMTAVLVLALVIQRRRRKVVPVGSDETAEELISALAQLDQRYRSRLDTMDDSERASYHDQRRVLKERLRSALARSNRKA